MKKRKYLAIFMAMSMVAAPATAFANDDAEIVSLQAETDADEVSDYKDADSKDEAAPAVQAEESKIDNITALTDAIQKAASGATIQLDGNIEGGGRCAC